MTSIRALYWDRLPGGDTSNNVVQHAFWPSPVDHDACFEAAGFDEFADGDEDWDPEWLDIVSRAVEYLQRYGPATIQESAAAYREEKRLGWWQRLRGERPRIIFDSSLPISEQVVLTSRDDQFGPCIVSFGEVLLQTDSGHAILWVTCQQSTVYDPHEMALACASGRTVSQRSLDWRHLRSD
jgi:hypothetical protein